VPIARTTRIIGNLRKAASYPLGRCSHSLQDFPFSVFDSLIGALPFADQLFFANGFPPPAPSHTGSLDPNTSAVCGALSTRLKGHSLLHGGSLWNTENIFDLFADMTTTAEDPCLGPLWDVRVPGFQDWVGFSD